MNTKFNTNKSRSAVRLSVLFNDAIARERKGIQRKAIDRIVEKSTAIVVRRETKLEELRIQLEAAKRRFEEIAQAYERVNKDAKEQTSLSFSCPAPAERQLYSRNVADLRKVLDGFSGELEEISRKAASIEAEANQAKSEAERDLKAIESDPLIILWKAIKAEVRCRILRLVDAGGYEEALRAAEREDLPGLTEEVARLIAAKKVAVSGAKRLLHNPADLDLPGEAFMLGHLSEVVIAINRSREECGRWAVGPLGSVNPLRQSRRIWRTQGSVVFKPIADLVRNSGMKQAEALAAKAAA